MVKKVNVNSNENSSITERRAYDNRPVSPGEVLVPMMASEEDMKVMEVDRRNLRTWTSGGRQYTVMFYPVSKDYEQMAMQQFYSEVNEFLGERRDARCLVPQPDGSLKVCPKKNGDNRLSCSNCPHRGEYEREDKSVTSLDWMVDEYNYEPPSNRDDFEIAMLRSIYDDLFRRLEEINPRYAKIVSLGYEISSDGRDFAAGDKSELVKVVMEELGLKRSRAYQEIDAAQQIVRRLLYELM